jgi:hypothetical protein
LSKLPPIENASSSLRSFNTTIPRGPEEMPSHGIAEERQ